MKWLAAQIGREFCFRSDDRPYFDWTLERLSEHPEWEIDEAAQWPHESETYFQGLMNEYYPSWPSESNGGMLRCIGYTTSSQTSSANWVTMATPNSA